MFQIAVPWVEYVDAIESSHYDRPPFIVRISLPWPLLVCVAADRGKRERSRGNFNWLLPFFKQITFKGSERLHLTVWQEAEKNVGMGVL